MIDFLSALATFAAPALDVLLQATLILAVVAIVARRRPSGSAAWRHSVWLLGFALISMLPFAYDLLPRTGVGPALNLRPAVASLPPAMSEEVATPISQISSPVAHHAPVAQESGRGGLRPEASTAAAPAPGLALRPGVEPAQGPSLPGELAGTATPAPVSGSADASGPTAVRSPGLATLLAGGLVLIWGLGALAFALRGLAGRLRLRQWLRRARPLPRSLRLLAAEVSREVGLRRRLPLHESDALGGPALVGVLRPRVLLPRQLARESDPRLLRPLILHEAIHAMRRDHLTHFALEVIRAVLWFHPLVHLGVRAVTRDREFLTDAAVVSRVSRRSDYAEGILRVLQGGGASSPLVLGVTDGRQSEVEERLDAIIAGRGAVYGQPRAWARWTALGGLALLGFAVASFGIGLDVEVARAARPAAESPDLVAVDTQDQEVVASDEPVLVVIDLPEPRPHGGASAMIDWPAWRKAVAGRYVVEGRPLDFDGFKLELNRFGVATKAMRRASDSRQSRADLVIRVHPERQAVDLVEIVALARSSSYGMRSLRLSLMNRSRSPLSLPAEPPTTKTIEAALFRSSGAKTGLTLGPQGYEATTASIKPLLAPVRELLVKQTLSQLRLMVGRGISAEYLMDLLGGLDQDLRARVLLGRNVDAPTPPAPAFSKEAAAKSIEAGLNYLLRVQDPSGAISVDPTKDEAIRVGRTALATLAFIEQGSTHQEGPHKKIVDRAAEFLQGAGGRRISQDGCLGGQVSFQRNYAHAVATIALAKLYAKTKDETLRPTLERAVKYILKAQNPYRVWRYGVCDGDNDSSISSWMATALIAARDSGIKVQERSFEWTRSWFEEMTDKETGRIGYNKRGSLPVRSITNLESHPATEVETPTAMGLSVMAALGQKLPESETWRRGATLLGKKLPEWSKSRGSIDLVYWYWGTRASRAYGEELASGWNAALGQALIAHQLSEGVTRGSWNPLGAWGDTGGRVATSALAVLALQEACAR